MTVRRPPEDCRAAAKASAAWRAWALSWCESMNTTRAPMVAASWATTCSATGSRSVGGSIARRFVCTRTPGQADRPALEIAARLELEGGAQLAQVAGYDRADQAPHLRLRGAAGALAASGEDERHLHRRLDLPQHPVLAREHHASAARH